MITVIVPAYNEESSIAETVRHISDTLRDSFVGGAYEIVVVNDGSTDGTGKALGSLSLPNLHVVARRSNRGYGAAIKLGLRRARFEHIAITDADGTYPNDVIPDLYRQFRDEELDMIVGSRTGENVRIPLLRRPVKAFLRHLASYLVDEHIPDLNSGLRIFRKDVAMRFYTMYPNGFSFTTTITMATLANDYDVRFVPIDYHERTGRSKIRPLRDTSGFLLLIVRMVMYFHPLRVFMPVTGVLGTAFLFLAIRDLLLLDVNQGTLLAGIMTFGAFGLGLIADLIAKKT